MVEVPKGAAVHATAQHTQTLFERLGGAEAVDAAVDIFYEKILKDPSVSGFFKNTDMNHQRQQQKAFLTVAFGGPQK